MGAVDTLRERMPDAARDIKLNLGAVLQGGGALAPAQRWGVAAAAAIASRNPGAAGGGDRRRPRRRGRRGDSRTPARRPR